MTRGLDPVEPGAIERIRGRSAQARRRVPELRIGHTRRKPHPHTLVGEIAGEVAIAVVRGQVLVLADAADVIEQRSRILLAALELVEIGTSERIADAADIDPVAMPE